MSRLIRHFLAGLAISCFFATGIHALSYIVSGGGSTIANGTYTENGTYNGKPQYQYSDCYLRYISSSPDYWELTYYNPDAIYETLYITYHLGDIPPSFGWELIEGTAPIPIIQPDAPALFLNTIDLEESADNDGAITTMVTISYTSSDSDCFAGADGDIFTAKGYAAVQNLPAGLTAVITRTDSLTLSLSISGQAINHDNTDEPDDMAVVFEDSAFVYNDTSQICFTITPLTINFNQFITVGTGKDYSTIAAALAAADDGDKLCLAAETFTEAGLTVSNNITIQGAGAESTIVQAHVDKHTATKRVFEILNVAEVTLQDMSIRHGNHTNGGGGIYARPGRLVIERCNIYDNRITPNQNKGGGIYIIGCDYVLIRECAVYGNINTGTIQYCAGGGIYFVSTDTTYIENCTFSGNETYGVGNLNSVGGGAIYYSGGNDHTLINTTICNNYAAYKGGGIKVKSTDVKIKNTLIANNTSNSGPDVYCNSGGDYLISEDYNLIENTSDGNITGDTTHTIMGQDPLVDTVMQDNGGPTMTLALQDSSPAIDAGTDSGTPKIDQRGCYRIGTTDIGAFEYSGTLNKAPVAGSGNALDFDGTDDYVAMKNLGTYSGITIALWFNAVDVDLDNEQGLVSSDAWEEGAIHFNVNMGEVCAFLSEGGSARSRLYGGTLSDNTWHHAAITADADANEFILYVDGEQADRDDIAGSVTAVKLIELVIGSEETDDYDRYFNGRIDEVSVWKTVKTDVEIRDLMFAGLSGNEDSLVAYFRFDEPFGTRLPDKTANGYDGTVTNMTDEDWTASTAWRMRTMSEDDSLSVPGGYDLDYDTLTIIEVTAPVHGTLLIPELTFVPDSGWTGMDSFSFEVSDGSLADTFMVMVTVDSGDASPVNSPPVITSPAADTAYRTVQYYYAAAADDSGDSLTYSIADHPAWLSISGLLVYGVVPDSALTDTAFTVIATDGELSDTQTVQLVILPGDSKVPVDLTSFTATGQNGLVVLEWTTASELYNLGWDIRRGAEALGPFTDINDNLIPGAGTVTEPMEYSYTDSAAAPGLNYYLLVQYDIGGERTFSHIIAAYVGVTGISPGPGDVQKHSPERNDVIYDLNGCRISKEQLKTGIYLKKVDGKLIRIRVFK